MKETRRNFIKKAVTTTAAASVGGVLAGFSAKSYTKILGAGERIRVALMGVNSRGLALAQNYAIQPDCEIIYVCDVDSRAADKCISTVEELQHSRPDAAPDFRKALEDRNLDVLVVAAPDHWHTPAAILACKAGKHVYLEKPCSHNPNEGELVVAATQKYKRVIQMGNQYRSCPNIISAIQELHDGIIGRPYFAKTWYANNRQSIGHGKKTSVPSRLDYDLWQGPAPRRPYKNNVIHYNWHWFWNWGTGEALNNGTHMVDLARWGLGVDYPSRITSSGGRYRYKDDWETPDTQVITMEFENNTCLLWEGRSCNGLSEKGSSYGVIFYGEDGAMLINNCNSITVYDLSGRIVKQMINEDPFKPMNLQDPTRDLDAIHIRNFFDGIRKGIKVNSEILGGHQSTLLCHLGNIALRSGNTLHTDSKNGHIINDPLAMKYWSREYEPGWEPAV